MYLPSSFCPPQVCPDVFPSVPSPGCPSRRRPLSVRTSLLQLRLDRPSADLQALRRDYTRQAAHIETERYVALQAAGPERQLELACHFDEQHHDLVDRVTARLGALVESRPSAASSRKENGQALSPRAVRLLGRWYDEHHEYPYPSCEQLVSLARQARVSRKQARKWLSQRRSGPSSSKAATRTSARKALSFIDTNIVTELIEIKPRYM